MIPVVGANRTAFEPWPGYPGGGQRFYGSSFISDHRGDLVAELGRDEEGVILATVDLDFLAAHRAAWGFFPRPPARSLRVADHRPAGVIETERLILRPWREADRAPFVAMSADPAVMDTLGGVLSAEQAQAYIERAGKHLAIFGFTRWAVERRDDGAFIGAVGLAPIHASLPMPAGFEMGWRLARNAWGQGYASEAAAAAIEHGFEQGLTEVFAFTSRPNLRSQAVMARAGLTRTPTLDFDHRGLPEDHPLRPHMVWMARR
ncbi:MAG: GNAT family N-acetyltransferase [Caulobacteraceae bacterium]